MFKEFRPDPDTQQISNVITLIITMLVIIIIIMSHQHHPIIITISILDKNMLHSSVSQTQTESTKVHEIKLLGHD